MRRVFVFAPGKICIADAYTVYAPPASLASTGGLTTYGALCPTCRKCTPRVIFQCQKQAGIWAVFLIFTLHLRMKPEVWYKDFTDS